MKKLILILLAIVNVSGYAQEVPQLETYTLKNGVKIYLMKYGKIPAVNIKFVINTGEKNEAPGQQGYCGLTVNMLLKGNSKYTEEQQNNIAFNIVVSHVLDNAFDGREACAACDKNNRFLRILTQKEVSKRRF